MKILLLTNTRLPVNGWGTVTESLLNGVAAVEPQVEFEVFTSETKGLLQRNSLKSEQFYRKSPWCFLHDVCDVLRNTTNDFDLIHAMVEHYAVPAMLLSRIRNKPYIITAHGTYGVSLPTKHFLYRKAFARADRVVCDSNYTKRRMDEEGVAAKYSIVYLGIDKNRFRADASIVKSDLITFVGNLKARKGLLFLLKALAELKREGMSYPLAVIGNIERNSSDFENITSFIKENGLSVTFTGKVSEDELIGYYQRAKLNVLPSKSSRFNFEGFGLVHLEANACGTLSIGTLNSGNEDAIKQGNGFLVEYDDVPALAAAIRTVMAGRYSPPDREIVPSYNDLACDYLDIYRDVIAASGSIA